MCVGDVPCFALSPMPISPEMLMPQHLSLFSGEMIAHEDISEVAMSVTVCEACVASAAEWAVARRTHARGISARKDMIVVKLAADSVLLHVMLCAWCW